MFLIFDLLYLLFSALIYTISIAASYSVVNVFWGENILINSYSIALGYFVFLNVFVITIGIFKLLLQPRLAVGEFPIGANKKYTGWVLNSLSQGIFIASPFSKQCHFLFYLNWIYYKMMGMNLPFSTLIGMNTTIRQPELIKIGKKSVLGLGSILSCHYTPNGKTHVQKNITIGHHSVIGGFAGIAPGVEIGNHTVIGVKTNIYPDVKIGNNVKIGGECIIHTLSIIPDNVQIIGNSYINKDCKIEANEIWGGSPAVKISDKEEKK